MDHSIAGLFMHADNHEHQLLNLVDVPVARSNLQRRRASFMSGGKKRYRGMSNDMIGRVSSRQPLRLGRFLLFRGWSTPSAGERVVKRLGGREGQAACAVPPTC